MTTCCYALFIVSVTTCCYALFIVSVTTCSLHDLIFYPEGAGNIFLHNILYMYVTNYRNHSHHMYVTNYRNHSHHTYVTNYRNHILQVYSFHSHHHECLKFHSLQFVSNLTRCGTRSASTVQTVIDLWIQYWHVMVLTVRYTARHAIRRSLVPRALVMAMLPLWCLPMANQLFLSKWLSVHPFWKICLLSVDL